MTLKRTLSFVIDFIVIIIAFNIINSIIPNSDYVKELEVEQNQILEDYTSHDIGFDKYFYRYSKVVYALSKERLSANIIYTIFLIIYVVIIPYIFKGRTLGTYINGLQIERFDKGKLKIHQLFIRNSIVFGLIYLIVSNLCIFISDKYYYLAISSIGLLQIIVALFSANMILFTKNKRGIQDLISNTEIVKILKI